MVTAVVQREVRERHEIWSSDPSMFTLSYLLIQFLEFFGNSFNYKKTGIRVTDNGSFFVKGTQPSFDSRNKINHLCIINPCDSKLDVGAAAWQINACKISFSWALAVSYVETCSCTTPALSLNNSNPPFTLSLDNGFPRDCRLRCGSVPLMGLLFSLTFYRLMA
jgi:hypothetical protein